MPYDNYKPLDALDYNEKLSDLKETSIFYTRKNLTDLALLDNYANLSRNSWKLVDLKAYKDENSMTKFEMIWSKLPFYEGTSRIFIGLNKVFILCIFKNIVSFKCSCLYKIIYFLKNETLDKIDEMTAKGLYPKIVTGYCYSSKHGEHLYALLFCQF